MQRLKGEPVDSRVGISL